MALRNLTADRCSPGGWVASCSTGRLDAERARLRSYLKEVGNA